MFVRDSIPVDSPFELVAPRFVRDPAWLEPIVASAVGEPGVRCRRGVARHRSNSLVVPFAWEVESHRLPAIDGDLAIAPVTPSSSEVTYEATYELGPNRRDWRDVAAAVDAAVHAFLVALAAALGLGTSG